MDPATKRRLAASVAAADCPRNRWGSRAPADSVISTMAPADSSTWWHDMKDRNALGFAGRIPAARIRWREGAEVLGGSAPGSSCGPEAPDHPRIRVEPVFEGGCITKLRVHCGCGASTEVECCYQQSEGEDERA